MNKSPIKARILTHLRKIGISKYKFYKNTGITRGVLDAPSGISEENIAKYIAYYAEINPEWLLTGKGPMLRDPKDEAATSYGLQTTDSDIEILREEKYHAIQEAKEASQRAEEAWRQLAEARQKIVQLTEVIAVLKAANTELTKQLDPEEQLKHKKAQEDRDPTTL